MVGICPCGNLEETLQFQGLILSLKRLPNEEAELDGSKGLSPLQDSIIL